MARLLIQEQVRDVLSATFSDLGFTKTWSGSLKNHWIIYGDTTLYAVEFWQLQDEEDAWCVHIAYGKLEKGSDRWWTSTHLATHDSSKGNTWFPPMNWGDGLSEDEWIESTPEIQSKWEEMIQVTLSCLNNH